jgi:hypothetical protein
VTAVRTWRNAHGVDEGGSAVTPAGSEPFQPGPTIAKVPAPSPVVRVPA